MTVSWKFRLVRLRDVDVMHQQQVVLDGLLHGWILDAQEPATDGSVDFVFRRAAPTRARDAWA